jgi:hypothetical protein
LYRFRPDPRRARKNADGKAVLLNDILISVMSYQERKHEDGTCARFYYAQIVGELGDQADNVSFYLSIFSFYLSVFFTYSLFILSVW